MFSSFGASPISIFGNKTSLPVPLATSPKPVATSVYQFEKYNTGYYLRGALAGGICCSITHGGLCPVDVVKTRIQLNPAKYNQGMLGGFRTIIAEEGAGALASGLGPTAMDYTLGITKAYTTRVGEGPFPTELTDETGELLGSRGKEFGTVTSRKRRCGWFDGVLVRQTIKISGIDGIALTKLDVLDELDEIKMCIEYELDGKKMDYLPAAVEDQLKIKPIYKIFPGWKSSTQGIKNIEDLPENAKKYIYALENFIGTKVSSISTSPEREDTILLENPFEA